MSNIVDKLQSIAILRQAIDAKGMLPKEVLQKIEYKIRLECNYHSNKIEGGTLTREETRSVMVGNIVVDGKPLKDIREMSGHDEAMKSILKIGKGEKRLSERWIKDLHRAVIVAETTEQESEIGVWKQSSNHVLNYRGEKHYFTPPEEIPDAIHQLLNWLNAGLDKIHSGNRQAPHPLLLVFEFHLRYLSIHPFVDGNGRTARLLTNLLLVSLGYPPFWVAEGGEKDVYSRYLADIQAYGGSPDLLYAFMANLVERSLQLVLDAAEGKDLDGLDDWKKKVGLLKSVLPKEDAFSAMRSTETIETAYLNSIKPAISKLMQELSVYDDLFLRKQMWFGPGSMVSVTAPENLDAGFQISPHTDQLCFSYCIEGFKKIQNNPFSVKVSLIWKLNPYHYLLLLNELDTEPRFIKQYGNFYDTHEIKEIINLCGTFVLAQIERNTLV